MLLSPRDTTTVGPIASAYQLRPTAARRISRLRVSWFVLGVVCGSLMGIGAAKLTEKSAPLETPIKASTAPDITATPTVVTSAPVALINTPVANSEPPVAAPANNVAPVPAAISTTTTKPEEVKTEASKPVTPPASPAKPVLQLPATISLKVEKKQTLASILMEKGVPHDETLDALESLKKLYNPKRITRGQTINLKLVANPHGADKASLASLALDESPLKTITLTRQRDGKFVTKETKNPVYKG